MLTALAALLAASVTTAAPVATTPPGSPLPAAQLAKDVQAFVSVDAPVVALAHVRVVDGTGAPPRDDQTILIAGGRIQWVGEAASASVPSGAKVLDLHGRTVIPGLVGMHDHLFYPLNGTYGEMAQSFPRLYLAAGVTTIRTTGSIEPYTDLEVRRAIEAGKAAGPKIHVTGPYLQGEGASTLQMHQLRGADDARKTVAFWAEQGADSFKAYTNVTRAELKAAIDEAHRRKLKVTAHLCSVTFGEAAALGIDGLEHGLVVATDFVPDKEPDACPPSGATTRRLAESIDFNGPDAEKIVRTLVERHVAVTSTLPVFETFVPGRALPQRALDVLAPDLRAAFLAGKLRAADPAYLRQRYGMETSPWPALLAKEMAFERAFAKAGGLLLAGLDPTGFGGVVAGFGDQRELELLVEAGFTPVEAIRIATSNGARFLGEADRIGSVAPGRQADLVVVRGDPATRIEDVENVELVFKDGVGYDPEKLVASVRGLVGLR
jgi:imidazolonepropionase-like amidohydrolase